MTVTARILSINHCPVSEDFIINDDDFSEIESEAEKSVLKCCIYWWRSSDGQSAYWGPEGATFEPHWYG